MGAKKRPLWRAVALTAAALAGAGMLAVAPAAPAHADPECVNGAYMLWVRGSGQTIGDVEAARFRQHVTYALNAAGIGSYAWAELGNLDNNRGPGERPDSPNEYPAVPVDNWHAINVVTSAYANSVTIGVNEFIAHLNDRYAGDGPTGKGRCSREVLVIGAYSQGANVVGDALQRQGYGSLSQAARNHIGFFCVVRRS